MSRNTKCKGKFIRRSAGLLLSVFLAIDLLVGAALVFADYFYTYAMPHRLDSVGSYVQYAASRSDWGVKFKDKFSDETISTDTLYKSPNISVELTRKTYDSRFLDKTAKGKHIKYGTKISYIVADIYIRNIECLQSAFAKDTYGVGYSEKISDISTRLQSVLAINGDSYSNNRHKENGTIIRNGIVYRIADSTEETCVLYHDGKMKIYPPDKFDPQKVIAEGAWQTWVFGPSLLDKNGKAKTDFLTWKYIKQGHPRTALGYYEPGHYCFLIVDGRQPGYSRGMFLEEMSKLFESLGCKAAYNLDGGHSSFMLMKSKIVSHPYRPKREISDGIFICEPEVK